MYTVHVQAQQEPVTLLFLTQGNKTQVTVSVIFHFFFFCTSWLFVDLENHEK